MTGLRMRGFVCGDGYVAICSWGCVYTSPRFSSRTAAFAYAEAPNSNGMSCRRYGEGQLAGEMGNFACGAWFSESHTATFRTGFPFSATDKHDAPASELRTGMVHSLALRACVESPLLKQNGILQPFIHRAAYVALRPLVAIQRAVKLSLVNPFPPSQRCEFQVG